MNQYDEALKATATAENSAGSGYRENAEYLKSYEAQINSVKNAWTEAIISFRDSGLGDAMVLGLNTGLEFFKAITAIVDKLGLFPAVIGVSAGVLALFSDNVRGLIIALGQGTVAFTKLGASAVRSMTVATPPTIAQTQAINVLSTSTLLASTSMDKMSVSTAVTSNAIRALTATTTTATTATRTLNGALVAAGAGAKAFGLTLASVALPIAGLMLIGAAISKITEKIVENTQKQKEMKKEFEDYKQKNLDAVSSNKTQVDSLISSYEKLSNARNSGQWNTEKEEEYLRIQQELGELFPVLVDRIDEKGRKHLISAEAIKSEREEMEKLLQRQKELDLANAKDTYKEKIADIEEYTKKIERAQDILDTDKIIKVQLGMSLEDIEAQDMQAAFDIQFYEKLIAGVAGDIRTSFFEHLKTQLSTMGVELSPVLEKSLNDAFGSVNIKGLDESKLNTFRTQASNIAKEMEDSFSIGDEDVFNNLAKDFKDLLVSMGATRDEAEKMTPTFSEIETETVNLAKSAKEGSSILKEWADSMDNTGESAEEAEKEIDKVKDAIEQLSGVSQGHIDDTENLLWQYELLSGQLSLLTEGTEEYDSVSRQLYDVTGNLASLYPSLSSEGLHLLDTYERLTASSSAYITNGSELSEVKEKLLLLYPELNKAGISRIGVIQAIIENITKEKEANDILRKAYSALKEGKLSAEEVMTLASLENTNSRITTINSEIEALDKLLTANKSMAESSREAAERISAEYGAKSKEAEGAWKAHMRYSQMTESHRTGVGNLRAELATLNIDQSKYLGILKSSENVMGKNTKATEKATKAQKDANKEMEKSIFLADKYKRKLEELSLEIQKQQDIQAKFPTYAQQHQDAIQTQIKLEQEKLDLFKNQSKELEAQIKSGNILQTGIVTTKTGGGTVKPSGFDGRITSQFGMRWGRMHEGIDIASPTGTRQDANVSGNVIRAEKHATYGNMVRIQDASGQTHTYAHLDKIAVRVGQKVTEGMQIGTVGNTGRSYGSHLHYEVRDKNGKAINPASYVEAARKGISTASKEVAQVQQGIDNAQSELIGLQGQIIDQEAAIASLEAKAIEAQASTFTHRKATNDKQLENSENRLKRLNSTSAEYREELEKQAEILGRKSDYNQQEIEFYENLIKTGGLSAVTIAEINEKLHQLGLERNALNFQRDDNFQEQLDSSSRGFDNRRSRLSRELEFEEAKLEGLEEGSERYFKTLEKINTLTEREIAIDEEELAVWEDAIKGGKLYGDALTDAKVKAEELRNSLMGLNNGLRENQERFAQAKFDINDKKIDEVQDKIDFLSYKLSMLGEEDVDLKVKIMLEMQGVHGESVSSIDNAISEAVALRNTAVQSGNSTSLYDDKIKGYVAQRRSQLSEMQSVYNNMQSMVENAHSKIAEAETKAYQDASEAINKTIKQSEDAIKKFSDSIDKLQRKMLGLQESNFDEKIGFTAQQLAESQKMARAIIAEYDKVASIPVYNTEQQSQVEEKLRSLKAELGSVNSEIINFVKSLERNHFDRLIYGVNQASKEFDRLTNKLNRNLEIIEGGMLSGTSGSLSLSSDSLVGKTLDLNSLISDPLAEKEIQTEIRDIRNSSYGQQIKDAEEYHAKMQVEASRFHKVMTEEIEKYEENLKLLMEIAKKDKEDIKKDEHKKILNSIEAMTKEEQEMMDSHYQSLHSAMKQAMSMYRQEYSSIWNGIISDLSSKLSQIEAMAAKARSAAASVSVPAAPTQDKATPVKKYAHGTSNGGHPYDGLAIVGDGTGSNAGSELIETPDGSSYLSPNSPTLIGLPKGTVVTSAKDTRNILTEIPMYAKGTSGKSVLGSISDSIKEAISKPGSMVGNIGKAIVGGISEASGYSSGRDSGRENTVNLSDATIDKMSKLNSLEAIYGSEWDRIKSGQSRLFNSDLNEDIKEIVDLRTDIVMDAVKILGNNTSLSEIESAVGFKLTPQDFQYYGHKAVKAADDGDNSFGVGSSLSSGWQLDFADRNNIDHFNYVLDYLGGDKSAPLAKALKESFDAMSEAERSEKTAYYQDLLKTTSDRYYNKGHSSVERGYSLGSGGQVSREYDPEQSIEDIAKDIEEAVFKPVKKALVHSEEFIEKWQPYKSIEDGGQIYEQGRQSSLDSIKTLQDKLKIVIEQGDLDSSQKLTQDILEEQRELTLQDQKFIIESLTDLAEQREKNALEARNALYDHLKNNELTEEAQSYYYDEIAKQDEIIANSYNERKKLIKQEYDYEQALRDSKLNDIKKQEEEINYLISLNGEDSDQEKLKLNEQLNQEGLKYLDTLLSQRQAVLDQRDALEVGSYEWNLLNGFAEDYDKKIRDSNLSLKQMRETILQIKFDVMMKEVEGIENKFKDLKYELDVMSIINPDDFNRFSQLSDKMVQNYKSQISSMSAVMRQLQEQQSLLEKGSNEWRIIGNQIDNVADKIRQANLALLQESKDRFSKYLQGAQKSIDKNNPSPSSERDSYLDGLEKEYEVQKLINFINKHNLTLSREQLAILNSKDKIEKRSFERLKKELEIQQLQLRLDNLRFEKNIQQLKKNEQGEWEYEYVADIDEIERTEEELLNKRIELERLNKEAAREDAQSSHDDGMKGLEDVLKRAENREFKSKDALRQALEALGLDLPIDEIIEEYWQYFETTANALITEALNKTISTINSKIDEFKRAGNEAGQAYAEGLLDKIDKISSGDGTLMEKQRLIFTALASEHAEFALAGNKLGMEFTQGLIDSMKTEDFEIHSEEIGRHIRSKLEMRASLIGAAGNTSGEAYIRGLVDSINEVIHNGEIENKTEVILSMLDKANEFGTLGNALGSEFMNSLTNTFNNLASEVAGESEGALGQAISAITDMLDVKIGEFSEKGNLQGVAYAEALKVKLVEAMGDAQVTQEDIIALLSEFSDFDLAGLLSGGAYSDSMSTELEGAESNAEASSNAIVAGLEAEVANFGSAGSAQGEAYSTALTGAMEGAASAAIGIASNIASTISGMSFNIDVGVNDNTGGALNGAPSNVHSFATGGYTGNSEGLAYLHSKEIVLNEDDTKNILSAVKMVDMFDPNKLTGKLSFDNKAPEQVFHINSLEFPNVKDATGFEDAFINLPNAAKARVRK